MYTRFILSLSLIKNPHETSLGKDKGVHYLNRRYEKCHLYITGCRGTIETLKRGAQSHDLQMLGVIHPGMLGVTEYWRPDEDLKGKVNLKRNNIKPVLKDKI